MPDIDSLTRAQQQYRGAMALRSAGLDINGFDCFFRPSPDPFYRNCAVPFGRQCNELQSVRLMARTFRARGLEPRLEFFSELWPELERKLVDQRFEVETRAHVMATRAVRLIDVPDLRLEFDGGIGAARLFIEIQSVIFGARAGTDIEQEALLLEQQTQGRQVQYCLGWYGGRVLSGAALACSGDDAELVSMWTVPRARRRHAATAVCRALLERFFNNGGQFAWLAVMDDKIAWLYRRLGFVAIGNQVNLRRHLGR